MTSDNCIIITAAHEPRHAYGRSLGRIAPELGDALTMIENRADERGVSRTWAGIVDESTFRRFAAAWRFEDQSGAPTSAGEIHTFDGMNWEVDGESPIIYVTVEVTPRITVASEHTPTPPAIRDRDSGAERPFVLAAVDAANPARTRGPIAGLAPARPDAIGTRISSAPDSGHANAPPPSHRSDAFVPDGWFG